MPSDAVCPERQPQQHRCVAKSRAISEMLRISREVLDMYSISTGWLAQLWACHGLQTRVYTCNDKIPIQSTEL